MTRPAVPAHGSTEWDEPLVAAIYDVSDRADTAVIYSAAQALTAAQQIQARTNINAASYDSWVTVVNPATDVRPAIPHVMWVGGATKPVNMVAGDLWVKA